MQIYIVSYINFFPLNIYIMLLIIGYLKIDIVLHFFWMPLLEINNADLYIPQIEEVILLDILDG